MIIKATISDTKQLTAIALQSKAFWGYSDDLIQSWTDELTVTEQMMSEMFVYKFLKDDKIMGFYILNQPKKETIELEFLFVLPEYIGQGIGNQLLQHSFEKAKILKAKTMQLLADPNAASFYESKGFSIIDKIQSAVFNRFLPLMQKDLDS
ncbi:GNAT family N-acetyltransferase [Polaribacter litorisediminis]|uniref:GNAT family N-acetyltransferase n=1 Tax=Polaribacter litorisediminis TaxID=1908341 RepID=UPI001CBF4B6E|nr:GNAT family N-acetyltransferase [Polaribacter litorisediminis]UAM98344.1 GNAT family N-acetyltransferase [Polaribacter litorisediminis]